MAILLAACMHPASAQDAIVLDMRIHVGADGRVIEVVPDESVPAELRSLLQTRVAEWHFSVPEWQGHPVSLWKPYALWLEPVGTTNGGYALRIVPPRARIGGPNGSWRPPVYPASLMRRGIGGAFVYAVRIGADGTLLDVHRRYPTGGLDRDRRLLDASSIEAIRAFPWAAYVVDGVAVACTHLYPITFAVEGNPPPGDPPVEALRAGIDDLCPETHPEPEKVGTFL